MTVAAITANFHVSRDACVEPGSFTIRGAGSVMWYRCPCGCGAMNMIKIVAGNNPANLKAWEWNGSTESPTLKPSVRISFGDGAGNIVEHWHGHLTDGIWRAV